MLAGLIRHGHGSPLCPALLAITITGCLLLAGATPSLTYHRPAQKGKNWCAYIVNKNVSCTVMEGTESFIQPQYKCVWTPQNQCQPTLAYRASFRPRYVTSYKVVTELEWRCCPNFKGHDCKDGPTENAKQTLGQTPRPSGGKKETEPQGQQHKQNDPKREFQELNEAQEKKIQTLEDEVLRLSQTVIDLQTSMSGVNDNLKITVQEDVSKFLNVWLNNLAPTASATGGKTEIYLPGFSGSAEKDDGIKDIVSELENAREELRNKSEQIDDLNRKINLYEERLIELEELSRASRPTVSGTNVLEKEFGDKIEELRNEMLEGMDRKMADLKNSCEYKLVNIKQQCEENEDCLEVKEMVLEKEGELRNEIIKLTSQIQNGQNGNSDCCKTFDFDSTLKDLDSRLKNFDLKVERLSEAHRTLNVRLDNEVKHFNAPQPDPSWNENWNDKLSELEFRINVTERNSEIHCFYIEDTLRGVLNTSIEDMNHLIDEKFQLLEKRLDEIDYNHPSSDHSQSIPDAVKDVNDLKDAVQKLDDELKAALLSRNGHLGHAYETSDSYKVLVQTQLDNSLLLKSITDSMNEKFEHLHNKTSDLETVQAALAGDLYKIEDSVDLLNKNFGSFKDQLRNMNSTVRNTQLTLSSKVDDVTKHLRDTSNAPSKCCDDLQDKFDVLKRELTTDKAKCTDNTQGVKKDISAVDARVSKLENVCGKLDTISGSLQRIKDGLNKHVTSLWNCINNINGTIKSHSRDIYGLKNSVQVFQTQVTKITTDLQDLIKKEPGADSEPKQPPKVEVIPLPPPKVTPKPSHPRVPQVPIIPSLPDQDVKPKDPVQPQLPQKPTDTDPSSPSSELDDPSPTGSVVIPLVPGRHGIIIQQGQAGAPGKMNGQTGAGRPKGGVDKDMDKDMGVSKGFAGAPGYPKPDKEVKVEKDPVITATFSEYAGTSVTTALISFSAGLTEWNDLENEPIHFNSELFNDGGHYNITTGIFTAPIEGRYLITAVLTPEREHHVEAVLSVSTKSVVWLDTSGYRRESLEIHGPTSRRQTCGGVGTFNLILPLKAGDEVSIYLTGGKLASSGEEMYSTFSIIFLYPFSSPR